MGISEETLGVRNDLSDMEASPLISTSSIVINAHEERTSHATIGNTTVVRSPWVGKSDTGWTRLAHLGLVNVRGSNGWRRVVAGYAA